MTNYAKKAFRNIAIVYTFSLFAAALGYLVRIYFARNLATDEFGLFYAIVAFLGLFSMFKSMGFDRALIYFIPKFIAESSYQKIKDSVIYSGTVLLVTNGVFLTLIFAFRNFLAEHFFNNSQATYVLMILAVSFFIDHFVVLVKYTAQGLQRMGIFSGIDLVRMILIAIASFVALSLGHGLLGISIAYVAAHLILFAIFYPIIFRKKLNLLAENQFSWNKALLNELFSFGKHMILLYLGGILIGYSDTLMLTYFRSLEEVGVYSAVYPFMIMLWYFPSSIANVFLPITSELWNKKLIGPLQKGMKLLYRYTLIIILPASSLLFVFAKDILLIFYGADYVVGSPALKILAIAIIFYSVHLINSSVFTGIGSPQTHTRIVIAGGPLNIVLNYFLIPVYGIVGAAIGTAVAYFVMNSVGIILLKKRNLMTPPYWEWFKTLLLTLLFLGVTSYLNWNITLGLFIKIPLILVVSVSAYVLFFFLLKLVSVNEVKDLISRITSRGKSDKN